MYLLSEQCIELFQHDLSASEAAFCSLRVIHLKLVREAVIHKAIYYDSAFELKQMSLCLCYGAFVDTGLHICLAVSFELLCEHRLAPCTPSYFFSSGCRDGLHSTTMLLRMMQKAQLSQ